MAWKIIGIIFVCLLGLGLVYFYRLGENPDNSNVTIVKRIVDKNKTSQAQDDVQTDQLLTNLSKDLTALQGMKDSPYLIEIMSDLKNF